MSTHSKPSKNEEEFFARADAELRKQLRERADTERAKAAQADRNRCPRCDVALVAKEHHGVTIDQCPKCEGSRTGYTRGARSVTSTRSARSL